MEEIFVKIENVVYILTNPQYPGYIKIGYASDLKQRLQSLNTGALIEFKPYAVYETPKSLGDVEIHKIIELLNPILRASKFNGGKAALKEFFKLEPEEAYELFQHIAVVSGTEKRLYRVDDNLNKIVSENNKEIVKKDNNIDVKQSNFVYEKCNFSRKLVKYSIFGEEYQYQRNTKVLLTLCNSIVNKVGTMKFNNTVLNDGFLKSGVNPMFSKTDVYSLKGLNANKLNNGLYIYLNMDKGTIFKRIDYIVSLFPECELKYFYEK